MHTHDTTSPTTTQRAGRGRGAGVPVASKSVKGTKKGRDLHASFSGPELVGSLPGVDARRRAGVPVRHIKGAHVSGVLGIYLGSSHEYRGTITLNNTQLRIYAPPGRSCRQIRTCSLLPRWALSSWTSSSHHSARQPLPSELQVACSGDRAPMCASVLHFCISTGRTGDILYVASRHVHLFGQMVEGIARNAWQPSGPLAGPHDTASGRGCRDTVDGRHHARSIKLFNLSLRLRLNWNRKYNIT